MPTEKLTEIDLKREMDDMKSRYHRLDYPDIFVAWFLRAFVTADEKSAVEALCGGPNDKGIDAVLIDDKSRKVFIVQGKYHKKIMATVETHADMTSFANLASDLSGDDDQFQIRCKKMSPDVEDRLRRSREKLLKQEYELQLFYVTTGKASKVHKDEARKSVKRVKECDADFEFIDGNRVLGLLDYYLRDVAPPVASLDLEMEAGNGVEVKSVFQRFDGKMDIESWVFSMTGSDIAKMYKEAGPRLFALNIRGYQGDTDINKGMEETLTKHPEYFWYYNNGLTIVCDDAEERKKNGRAVLTVSSPQVINGQQTTRTLAKMSPHNAKASVTVRVIRIPHTMDANSDHFDALVSQVVKSTNWQNYIVPSDLISNDRRQIEIHRQFRNLGYWYVRKRQTRGEAKREAGGSQYIFINKTELAQAVAGCDFDPSVVRSGKEKLFEEKMYGTIFPTSDPYFYLKRYWLKKEVEDASKGYPERAYAKWLVLNFMWDQVSPIFNPTAKRNAFEVEWKFGRGDALVALFKANNIVFRSAIQFYRLKRGKGAKATDISTFFKRKGLHNEFASFWAGSKNPNRNAFKNAMQKFESVLSQDN